MVVANARARSGVEVFVGELEAILAYRGETAAVRAGVGELLDVLYTARGLVDQCLEARPAGMILFITGVRVAQRRSTPV